MIQRPSLLAAVLLVVAISTASFLLTSCGRERGSATAAKEAQLYTCGMHPQVIQDHPGNCPICGMKLTPVRKQGAMPPAAANAGTGAMESAAIAIDPVTMQNMDLRTGVITRGPVRRTVRRTRVRLFA